MCFKSLLFFRTFVIGVGGDGSVVKAFVEQGGGWEFRSPKPMYMWGGRHSGIPVMPAGESRDRENPKSKLSSKKTSIYVLWS